ncbi:MAG: aminotransferase class IV [Synechocystis sp.]|nr:aminotransferase class IV [Synechocystis sp.]
MRYWFDGQWFDREFIQLPIAEPGLLYGATIFTTLRVYDQNLYHPLTHWSAHGDRLRQHLAELEWPSPDWPSLTQAAIALGQDYPVLRITLFPSGQAWILGRSLPVDLAQRQHNGITAWLAPPGRFQRSLAHWKTGNYFAPWLSQQLAQRQQAQEAILTNSAGHWLETSTGNLWGWRGNTFFTPTFTGEQLAGIAHHYLSQWLLAQGAIVHLQPWTSSFVKTLQGLAYSNSAVEIIPINTVHTDCQERLCFSSNQGTQYQRLADYFRTF